MLDKAAFFAGVYLTAAIVVVLGFMASWIGTAFIVLMGVIFPILFLIFGDPPTSSST